MITSICCSFAYVLDDYNDDVDGRDGVVDADFRLRMWIGKCMMTLYVAL